MKKIFILVSCLSILIFVTISIKTNRIQTASNETKEVPIDNKVKAKDITMKEAYEIGMKYGRNIDRMAKLIRLNSVDDGKISGDNGKKKVWQLLIDLPQKDKRVGLNIVNGNINDTIYLNGKSRSTDFINEEDFKYDSDSAVILAIKNFKLEPGDRNNYIFKGYHFKLIKENNFTFLTVVGNKGNEREEIHMNARTGEYLGRTQFN